MTSLKRPLEMELMFPNRASPPTPSSNSILNSAKAHKKRCINNVIPNPNQISDNVSDQLIHNNLNHNDHQQNYQQQQHNHDQNHQHHNHREEQKNHHQQLQQYNDQQQSHHHNQQQQPHNQHHHNLVGYPFRHSSMLNLPSIGDDLTNIIREELNQSSGRNETPIFSLRQTQAICEKLILLRERRLREEYDKILMAKLAEQYETFVKYTHDHIEKQYQSGVHQLSYLS